MIPAAHVLGGPKWRAHVRAAMRWRRRSGAGRVATWSATLGAAQAALLVATAGPHVDTVPAVAALALVFALAAALVVGTVWLLRLAVPMGRALAMIVTGAFYGAAALASPDANGVLAATLLVPALVWSLALPRGTFAITASCSARGRASAQAQAPER